jgi:TolA-binding protein
MLTKDVTLELEAIISQLVADGKDPSVALIKTRLSQTVPMPAIITTLRSWKASKKVPKVEVTASDERNSIEQQNEQRIAQLEQHITQLLTRVEKLEAQLSEK